MRSVAAELLWRLTWVWMWLCSFPISWWATRTARTLASAPAKDPRIGCDDDGTLDDFMAEDVQMVHFEAIDEAAWYATITLADGRTWQLNFGAQDTESPGFARADQVS